MLKHITLFSCLILPIVAFADVGPPDLSQDLSATASQQEVHAVSDAWLHNDLQHIGIESTLPEGTTLDRTDVINGYAVAYMTMPADFLDKLDADVCEKLVREQVYSLKDIDGLGGFGILVRPDDDPKAEYRPLPEYLHYEPQEEKWEPEYFDFEAPLPLNPGGMPIFGTGRPSGALSGKTVFISPGHGWYYSSTLGRWATQRGNSYGVIEDHSNGESCLLHLAQYFHNAGANVWPCRERDMNDNMVIIDNTDSSPSFTMTGTWYNSTANGTWYGSNYKYKALSATETATATYAPSFPETGYYSVYVWTPSASNRPTQAKVRVNHTGGTTEHTINMQRDGNTWRFLGMYHFDSGRDSANGSVVISNQGTEANKYVIADAVRFGGGTGTSGHPRWEESGKYFAPFMGNTGNNGGTVSAMPKYADWESESWEDSIYISWHSNATGSSSLGHGTDIYVYGPNGPPSPFSQFSGIAGSDSLAERLQTEIRNDLRADWNDSSWPADLFSAWFGELNPNYNNEMPQVLVETAFHDNEDDADSILDPRFRDLMARAIYQASVKWWYNDYDGPYSSQCSNQTLLPEPPTHLTVCNWGSNTVRVNWNAPPYGGTMGDAATGYIVQSSDDGFGFTNGTVVSSGTYLDVSGLTAGDVKYFRVIATNAGGQSFPSIVGGVKVGVSSCHVLVVNGFDRNGLSLMLREDDPYDTDDMIRERPYKMNNYGYIREFAKALVNNVQTFDFASNEAISAGHVSMGDYDAVIWQCGEESTEHDTFDSSEQSRMATFLSGGGKLFVSGAEIGWDLDYRNNGRSFFNNYLKADYYRDDANTYNVTPITGSIFAGLSSFSFDNGTTQYDAQYPDVYSTYGGSTAAMSYVGGYGGNACVVYDGATFKVVHFGFPFETITSATAQEDIMEKIIDFFNVDCGMISSPEAAMTFEEVEFERQTETATLSKPTRK